jgi:hypothetical protein
MKVKNLRKKIRSLEARLEKDAKKLTKLKRKLGAATTAGAGSNKKKSGEPGTSRKETARTQSAKGDVTNSATPAAGKEPNATKKVKKKLNLSPERRAQLAAAMKARWTAKRAAALENPQEVMAVRDFTLEQAPHTPQQM